MNSISRWQRLAATLALALVAGAGGVAFSPAVVGAQVGFPRIPAWLEVGAFKDSTDTPRGAVLCLGALGPRSDSLVLQPRTLSLRFHRDSLAESRLDFGGYRIYRMINTPDTTRAVLVRRFSINNGSELSWNFSRVDSASGKFICGGTELPNTHNHITGGISVTHDKVVTFVDPDSSGAWVKVCRFRKPDGTCIGVKGDSIMVLVAPPGPHDGFRTYYSITYEAFNGTAASYEDLFVPDSSNSFALCDTTGLGLIQAGQDLSGALRAHIVNSCPNLNNKLYNLVGPVEPTGGPSQDLEHVTVVPNPFHASEAWDGVSGSELHFINLPKQATIKIFTVSGDLIRVLHHSDLIRDYEIWDLKTANGRDAASGIYIYAVTTSAFSYRSRFVVIR